MPECPEGSQGEEIEKKVQEALIAGSEQVQEELTAPTIHNEEFTELKADHVKLQEQLQCVIEEMNLPRQFRREGAGIRCPQACYGSRKSLIR